MYFLTQVVLAVCTVLLFAIRNKSVSRVLSKVMARVPFLESKLLLPRKESESQASMPRRSAHMPRGHARSTRALGELTPKYKRDPSIFNENEPITHRPEE